MSVPEFLLEGRVFEPIVVAEAEPYCNASRAASLGGDTGRNLEASDVDIGQMVGENGGIRGLDVLIDIRRSLFEYEWPEVGDLGDESLSLFEKRSL